MLQKRDNGAFDGWFLVRKSTKEKNTFVITLALGGKLYHNQIAYRDGMYGTTASQGNHQYETLQQVSPERGQGPCVSLRIRAHLLVGPDTHEHASTLTHMSTQAH